MGRTRLTLPEGKHVTEAPAAPMPSVLPTTRPPPPWMPGPDPGRGAARSASLLGHT